MSQDLLSKILEHTTTPLCIKGDYNTGKTTLLTQKILSLLAKNTDEDKIFLLHSKQTGLDKISSQIYNETGKSIHKKTINEFFLFLILENKEFLRDPKKVTCIEKFEMEFFFYQYCEKEQLQTFYPKKTLHEISKELLESFLVLRKKGITLQKIHQIEFVNFDQKSQLINVFVNYETYKKKNNFIDSFDVIEILKEILQNTTAHKKIQSLYSHIFIDDFEELTKQEAEIIIALFKNNIYVSTNPNRRIQNYFSKNEDVYELFELIQKPKILHTQINYKNNQLLLENYYFLLEKNSENKLTKKSQSSSKATHTEDIFSEIVCENQKELKKKLLYKAKEFSTNYPNKTLGIICKNTNQATQISQYLSLFGITHSDKYSKTIFTHPLIKEVLKILKIIEKPREENILLFDVISSLDIKEQTLLKLSRKVQYFEKSYYELFKNSDVISETESENTLLKNFFSSLQKCVSLKETKLPLKEFMLQVLFEFGFYYKALQHKNSAISHLNEFIEIISIYEVQHQISTLKECNIFLKILQEQETILTIKQSTSKSNFSPIQITTFENAKEFQFDEIVIPFCVDKVVPEHFSSRKKLFPTPYDFTEEEFNEFEFHQLLEVLLRAHSKITFFSFENYDYTNFKTKKSPLLSQLPLVTQKIPDEVNVDISKENILNSQKENIISTIFTLLKHKNYQLAQNEIKKLEALEAPKGSLLGFLTPQINDEIKKVQSSTFTYDFSKHFYSVSQLKTYQQCPKKYLFQYIYKIPTPSKHYFDFGTSVHSVLEEIKPQIDNGLDKRKALLLSLKLLSDLWISQSYLTAHQEKEYYSIATQILENYIEKEYAISSNLRTTLALEKKFFLNLEGKKIMGFIDRIDSYDNEIIIYDYKTSNSMENKSYLENDLQLYTYALAVKEDIKYASYPKKMALWYLKHNMISSIEFKEEKAQEIKKKLLELIHNIESKDFTAKPTLFSCTYCDFNSICDDAKTRN